MEHEGLLVAEREIEVNNYDIDAMGIVSNIVYIRWFEIYVQYLLMNI